MTSNFIFFIYFKKRVYENFICCWWPYTSLSYSSYLQKGFTKGESPSIAGLVLTELNIEAKEKRNPVYIALTDAKKAFDKVWHEGLYREMHKMNIYGDNWLM
jgi:hypothetical protein